jgi:DNA-binding transcriptional MerR regulator
MLEFPELTKVYYTIGEVADMFKVNQSLIRFWEKEFNELKPSKNNKGDRRFTPKDIEKLKLIYHLVKERGFTLEGAKMKLKENPDKLKDNADLVASLQKVKSFLLDLKEKL